MIAVASAVVEVYLRPVFAARLLEFIQQVSRCPW
jgi:hypothetical protein